jgi:hypothetical protein
MQVATSLIQPEVLIDVSAAGARASALIENKRNTRQMLQSEKFPYFITKVTVSFKLRLFLFYLHTLQPHCNLLGGGTSH